MADGLITSLLFVVFLVGLVVGREMERRQHLNPTPTVTSVMLSNGMPLRYVGVYWEIAPGEGVIVNFPPGGAGDAAARPPHRPPEP